MKTGVWMLAMVAAVSGLTMTGCKKTEVSEVPDAPPPLESSSSASGNYEPVPYYDPAASSPPPRAAANTGASSAASNEVMFDDTSVETIEVKPAAARTHTLQKRETLWKVAERYYGDGKKWRDIAAANGISDPTKVPAGAKLIIP